MLDHSFTFNGHDMREEYGIIVENTKDTLWPKLRSNKITIPRRDGATDFGAQYYDERTVETVSYTHLMVIS